MTQINPMNAYAQAIHGCEPGWEWFAFTCDPEDVPEGYCRVTGGVPAIFSKGPRKGKKNWDANPKTKRTIWYRLDDFQKWLSEQTKELASAPHP